MKFDRDCTDYRSSIKYSAGILYTDAPSVQQLYFNNHLCREGFWLSVHAACCCTHSQLEGSQFGLGPAVLAALVKPLRLCGAQRRLWERIPVLTLSAFTPDGGAS